METKERILKNDYINYILLLAFAITLSISCLAASPLWNGVQTNDSIVFQLMGKGLLEGKVIYKDIFDHKGPIMYIINAIGILINNKYGIWIIETILIYISSIFIYKTSRLFLRKEYSIFISAIYLFFLFIHINSGNLTEDYSCIFSSIGLYYITRILYNNEMYKKKNWIMIGLTFSLAFFTKPTYISLWIAFGIAIIIKTIKHKNYIEFAKDLLYAFVGFMLITLPIILYIIITNSAVDFLNGFLLVNMKYSNSTITEKAINFIELTSNGYNIVLIFMIICNIIIYFEKKLKLEIEIKIFSTTYLVFTIILTAMAPYPYTHYLTQLATMMAFEMLLIISYTIVKFNKQEQESNNNLYSYLIVTVCLIMTLTATYLQKQTIFNVINDTTKEEINETIKGVEEKITDNDYECLIIGNKPELYVYLDKYTDFKYFFQYPIAKYDESIIKETVDYIKNEKPKLIMIKGIKDEDFNTIITDELKQTIINNYNYYYENKLSYYLLK